MKMLSERLTEYVIKNGVISKEQYSVYQYGFQIGLEMFCCFFTCFIIAIWLNVVPDFIISTGIFILLRTYAGGIHLHSFLGCFICSVTIQTLILLINVHYTFTWLISWFIICIGTLLMLRVTPVENINRKLDSDDKIHCKKIAKKILIGIIILSAGFSFCKMINIVSLIALTILLVIISQYTGIVMYKFEKNRRR